MAPLLPASHLCCSMHLCCWTRTHLCCDFRSNNEPLLLSRSQTASHFWKNSKLHMEVEDRFSPFRADTSPRSNSPLPPATNLTANMSTSGTPLSSQSGTPSTTISQPPAAPVLGGKLGTAVWIGGPPHEAFDGPTLLGPPTPLCQFWVFSSIWLGDLRKPHSKELSFGKAVTIFRFYKSMLRDTRRGKRRLSCGSLHQHQVLLEPGHSFTSPKSWLSRAPSVFGGFLKTLSRWKHCGSMRSEGFSEGFSIFWKSSEKIQKSSENPNFFIVSLCHSAGQGDRHKCDCKNPFAMCKPHTKRGHAVEVKSSTGSKSAVKCPVLFGIHSWHLHAPLVTNVMKTCNCATPQINEFLWQWLFCFVIHTKRHREVDEAMKNHFCQHCSFCLVIAKSPCCIVLWVVAHVLCGTGTFSAWKKWCHPMHFGELFTAGTSQ